MDRFLPDYEANRKRRWLNGAAAFLGFAGLLAFVSVAVWFGVTPWLLAVVLPGSVLAAVVWLAVLDAREGRLYAAVMADRLKESTDGSR